MLLFSVFAGLTTASEELEVVLGAAPRDFRNPNFQRIATCPGSRAVQHTRAQSTITFTNSCADVSAEIQARANGQNGWKDPHNRGRYTMEANQGNLLKLRRRTGNNRYTDQITFALADTTSMDGSTGCSVNACSVSQGNSNNDAGTSMCNMGNLFCNSSVKNNQNGVACKSVTKDLTYTVPYLECGRLRAGDGRYLEHNCQNFASTCLRQASFALEEELFTLPAEENELLAPLSSELVQEVVLGAAPRDFRNPNFQRIATCPGSRAVQHTRAQSTITFTNSCADVSAEIQARANGQNGWRDPHNRGRYTMEANQGNLLKLRRRTGNNRYTDQITFALADTTSMDGSTGCSVNACSVSQGNSNNDAGTSMCNMGNLFCNSSVKNNQNGVACKSVTKDLTYTVPYLECGRMRAGDGRYLEHNCQNFANTCLRQASLLDLTEDSKLEMAEGCTFLDDTYDDCRSDALSVNGHVIPAGSSYTFDISTSERFEWYCGSTQEHSRINLANQITGTVDTEGRIRWVGMSCASSDDEHALAFSE